MNLRFCCFSPASESNRNRSRHGGENYQNFCVFNCNELKIATQGFSNQIGEGAFGSVYKGRLQDGTVVAVKVLSVELESMRGEREFISELAALSDIKHENLVTLRGCCVDGANRYLVYDYMENNSLAVSFLGGEQNRMKFSWEVRRDIILGVANGLAYLHEEVKPHIVHRDIKASNVLLDHNFVPKVSDFGLSRIMTDNTSHISTGVAGTLGYLAPEYAISGRLTRKSDVYSFGVMVLEIISRHPVLAFDLEHGELFLVQKAWEFYTANNLVQLVDPALEMNYPEEEAIRFLKVGLLCVQETAKLRPRMSMAVKMLTNEIDTKDTQVSLPGLVADLMNIKLGQKDLSRSTISGASTNLSVSSQHTTFSE
ncbi:Pkinase domain-containing protein [Cephalotus follicularis]|uniref:Pkinase domain-containing protein n=1 Tax=Cephalotus follicularis TaxID=3775 RepID=A0A1Q3B9U2_CEPFO|nr:Pkinase domain-containing protein [Cephalotus follicularis]